jgi:hypothetical protein
LRLRRASSRRRASPSARAGSESDTPRQVTDLRGKQACLTGLPISQYGNGTTSGYYFTNDGVTQFLTSALDVTDVGQAPGAYVAKIDASCIGTVKAMSKSSYRLDRSLKVTHALK